MRLSEEVIRYLTVKQESETTVAEDEDVPMATAAASEDVE
jgi:ribosomal protein S6